MKPTTKRPTCAGAQRAVLPERTCLPGLFQFRPATFPPARRKWKDMNGISPHIGVKAKHKHEHKLAYPLSFFCIYNYHQKCRFGFSRSYPTSRAVALRLLSASFSFLFVSSSSCCTSDEVDSMLVPGEPPANHLRALHCFAVRLANNVAEEDQRCCRRARTTSRLPQDMSIMRVPGELGWSRARI